MASNAAATLLAWLVLLSIFAGGNFATKKPVCEAITIQMCKDIGYNTTTLPNRMGHETQFEAAAAILEFKPLLEVQCAPHIKHFICSTFAPICSVDVSYRIEACRSFCEMAKRGCANIMSQFGYHWPFDCKKFPINGKGRICVNPPGTRGGGGGGGGRKPSIDKLFPSRKPDSNGGPKQSRPTNDVVTSQHTPVAKRGKCINTRKFVYVEKKDRCAAKCGEHVYFDETNKQFSDVWLLIWSTICFVSTIITVLTYLIDRMRFKYPERPIIYLAFCYMLYSSAYLIRLIAKSDGISCSANGKHLIMDGLNTAGCSIVFILLYYFGMASSLWWVMLTVTWFLSAALKWSQEAIANKSTYFHAVAWVIPAIQTITVLSTRKVDADELTGLCYVGNQNVSSLAGFVLAPLCIYLVVGTTFLLAGFISLFRIRSVLKDHDTNTQKLEKLMVRIGVFSVLYTLPAIAVIACFVYEYSNMEAWQNEVEVNCINVMTDDCNLTTRPKEEIYMVRHFMSLVVGITSGMWVWSTKTCQSWQMCYHRNFSKSYQRKPVRKQPLLVQVTTMHGENEPPVTQTPLHTEYLDQCGTSNVSHHPMSSCPVSENHYTSAPV